MTTHLRAFFSARQAQRLLLAGILLVLPLLLLSAIRAAPAGTLAYAAPAPPAIQAPAGAETATTPVQRTVTFAYDGAGRLQSAIYSGRSQSFQYDASGNLLAAAVRTNLYLPAVAKAAQ